MKAYYDLHIHSALSPCGDDDMTPNNIVNMASIIGLDLIAVCDHNCTANLPALASVAKNVGITLLPGIELSTAEEVHLLAYFKDITTAIEFGEFIYDSLPDIPNNETFFGSQFIMNENDEIIGKKNKLLISALPYDLGECVNFIDQYGGVAVPAHINKSANSLLANLGFFPTEIDFKTIEVWKGDMVNADIKAYQVIHNSDAHNLSLIAERENYISVDSLLCEDIIKKLSAI